MDDSHSGHNDGEKFEISAQEIFEVMSKIMEYTREEKIHPLLVMAACPVIEEYVAHSAGVSKREIDMSRRGAHRLVRALVTDIERPAEGDQAEDTDDEA